MNLKGNTIFITGGGSGIGLGLAEAFYKLGNRVIIGGRRREVLDRAAAANHGMETIVLDTTDPASVRAAAEETIRNHRDLNVVINNAGVQRVFDFAAAVPSEAAMHEEIETNINGVLRVTTAFLPHLQSKPAATLINISSGLAFVPLARYPIYCATKAFVHSFTMSLRHQLKNTSVRVVELAPPWVATDLDAMHRTSHGEAGPMPLPEFIQAAMEELSSDADELKVAGAKFLYSAGIGNRLTATFDQINH